MDGIIYKIEICNEIYIGSTIQKLNRRQNGHNFDLKRKNNKLQKLCRENDINNITLIEIEKVKINNKKELYIIEQDYINKLQPSLNSNRAIRTEEEKKEQMKEIYKNNKEKIKKYRKEYKKNNKEKIKAYDNKKVNCEFCGLELNNGNLYRHKKLYCKKN